MWKKIICGILLIETFLPANAAFQSSVIELTPIRTLKYSNWVYDVSWSFDGSYFASIDENGQVSIWDSLDWHILSTFNCGLTSNERLAWSPNQLTLAVGCYNHDIPISIEAIGTDLTIVRFDTRHQSPGWSQNGDYIAVPQKDGTINILNTSFETIYTLGEPISLDPLLTDEGISYLGFKWSPSGKYLASIGRGQAYLVTIWDLRTQQLVQDIIFAFDIMWSSDGDTFIVTIQDHGTRTGSLQTWTTSPLQMVISTPIPYDNEPASVEGSPNNQYLAYCKAENSLELYDTLTAEMITPMTTSGETIACPINDIAWSSNGLLAIAEQEDVVSIWEIKEGDG